LTSVHDLGSKSEGTSTKVKELEDAIEEINEKVWELDKSWKNNLVFYGIKQDSGHDEHPSVTESKVHEHSIMLMNVIWQFTLLKVRDVITKNLRITREVPIMRVKRTTNGPEVRGCKPVTVYFDRWQDKDDILRKSQMLRGANIYISEDFSKRVRDQVLTHSLTDSLKILALNSILIFQRQELQKYMKLMRQRRPLSKFSLQYDKLIVDNEIFMFNDLTGRVEQVNSTIRLLLWATKMTLNFF
jgi:hypothetical protein